MERSGSGVVRAPQSNSDELAHQTQISYSMICCSCLAATAEIGRDTYSTPAQALGEKLGNGHFLRAWAGDNVLLAVAIAPRADDDED